MTETTKKEPVKNTVTDRMPKDVPVNMMKKVDRANRRRDKLGKPLLSKSKAYAVAEKNLTIQDLVEA